MTELRTSRLACLALGESPPLLPGGLERAAAFACVARTVESFFAEIDAGAELPDAVLVFDGARVAAQLRRHERCGLLPILVFGPPGASLPPGCDAWVETADDIETVLRSARDCEEPPAQLPARDSERRALRFAVWMSRRGHADAADARAFGLDAPHSLFAAWEREGRVHADPERGWRNCSSSGRSQPARTIPEPLAPVEAPAPLMNRIAPEAAPPEGRFAWPALFLALFAIAALRAGGLLGPATVTRSFEPPQIPDRPVFSRGTMPGAAPAANPAAAAEVPEPKPSTAPPPAPAVDALRVVATGSVYWHEEALLAERSGVCEQRLPEGASFSAGEVLGALIQPEREAGVEPTAARAERIRDASARLSASAAHYQARSRLAAQGAIAWREVAPAWEALETARATLSRLEAEEGAAASAHGAPASLLLIAPQAGAGLRWMVPPNSAVQGGDVLLRFTTGSAWLEVRLEGSEWRAAAREPRAEMRLVAPEAKWQPIHLSGEERQSDGSVRLRFEALDDLAWQPTPLKVEVRWSLAAE